MKIVFSTFIRPRKRDLATKISTTEEGMVVRFPWLRPLVEAMKAETQYFQPHRSDCECDWVIEILESRIWDQPTLVGLNFTPSHPHLIVPSLILDEGNPISYEVVKAWVMNQVVPGSV
jgi:hypothetical protein